MAAKESEGLTDGGTAPPTSASLPAAQEASIAGQYSAMDIRGGKTGEEAEVSRLTSRLASNWMSLQTLFYAWNRWKSITTEEYLIFNTPNGPELNDYAVLYEHFCAKYFGV
ncbi:hypothetical protein TRIUR3_29447 [Triticum urartu]|uniref:Uncharacterized protein n=1 Tax=Triticum urartu TaxID=4572 RepID=M7ZWU8_TRIUA|nr:hypothetical protein TRIUR3_29447 [Triticum urartu]